MINTLHEILDEIQRQIDWRGPTGRTMGHIIIERDAMVRFIEAVRYLEALVKKAE